MTAGSQKFGDSHEESGGFIDGAEGPAFTLKTPSNPPIPVLIAVPHAGRAYPAALLERMRQPESSSVRLEDRHVDSLAAEVARLTCAPLIVAHAPRAMLDLNRDRDDVDWSMVAGKAQVAIRHSQANRRARSGLGLVPRRLPGFGEIWRDKLSHAELDARIAGIHRPYHSAVGRALEQIRDEWGAALLIDLHSMPPLRRRFDQDQAPEFVIGDRFGASCDSSLAARAFSYLELHGRQAAHNRPYSGGFVLDHHAAPARGLHAIQLEVCRASYLDPSLDRPSANLAAMARLLAGLVRELGAATARIARGRHYDQAAE